MINAIAETMGKVASEQFLKNVVLSDTLDAFWDHIHLKEVDGKRMITVDDIPESEDNSDFYKIYDFFKYCLKEKGEDGEPDISV